MPIMSAHWMKVPMAGCGICGSKNGYEAFFPFVKVNVGPVPVRLSSAFPVGSDLGRSPPWTGLDCMWLLNDFF